MFSSESRQKPKSFDKNFGATKPLVAQQIGYSATWCIRDIWEGNLSWNLQVPGCCKISRSKVQIRQVVRTQLSNTIINKRAWQRILDKTWLAKYYFYRLMRRRIMSSSEISWFNIWISYLQKLILNRNKRIS